jgi:hypothetical protein
LKKENFCKLSSFIAVKSLAEQAKATFVGISHIAWNALPEAQLQRLRLLKILWRIVQLAAKQPAKGSSADRRCAMWNGYEKLLGMSASSI